MSRDSGSVMPFVLGIGVGAIAALLFAPKAGDELRSDLADGMNQGAAQLNAGGKKLKQKVSKAVADAQEHVQSAIEAGQTAYYEAKDN